MAETETTPDEVETPVVESNAPSLLALQILEKLLIEAIKARQNINVAEADLRTVRELRPRLLKTPRDQGLVNWERQIAQRWESQLKNRSLRFRHLFDHLDLAR